MLSWYTWIVFVLFMAFQFVYLLVPLVRARRRPLREDQPEKGMSILVPAYNEALTIGNCLEAMDRLHYRQYELIIINDGSKDETLEVLRSRLDLVPTAARPAGRLSYKTVRGVYRSKTQPHIVVIDKINGGKADSLNAGIDHAAYPYVITLDADSMLEADSVRYVNEAFDDPKVAGLGGTVLIVQGASQEGGRVKIRFTGNSLILHQILHYIHGFFIKKKTQAAFNSMVVISGAFGAFRRELLWDIRGFRTTMGEDMDITLKIYQHLKSQGSDDRLVYLPEALCFTECPENYKNFYKQRIRWQQGFIDCVLQYWGRLHRDFSTAFILFFAFDGLLLGTIMTVPFLFAFADLLLHPSGLEIAGLMFLAVSVMDTLQHMAALYLLARQGYRFTAWEYTKMFFFAFYDRITWKILPTWINLAGSWKFFTGEEHWNHLQRKGAAFQTAPAEAAR